MNPQTHKSLCNYLQECLMINEHGILIWRVRPDVHFPSHHAAVRLNTRCAGKMAGRINEDGYIIITLKNKNFRAHRIVWLLTYGTLPEQQLDHINGIKTDNRIENLRMVSDTGNGQNRRNASKNNKSGLLGVAYKKKDKKYYAQIVAFGKWKHLGIFNTAIEAHNAYIKAKRILHTTCSI